MKSADLWFGTLPETNSEFTLENWCLGDCYFPCGIRPVFTGELLLLGRISISLNKKNISFLETDCQIPWKKSFEFRCTRWAEQSSCGFFMPYSLAHAASAASSPSAALCLCTVYKPIWAQSNLGIPTRITPDLPLMEEILFLNWYGSYLFYDIFLNPFSNRVSRSCLSNGCRIL